MESYPISKRTARFPIQKTTNSVAEATALIEKIKLAKEGDQHAFRYLLEFFWNDVYGFMLQRTQNENEAEDLTIRCFGKAFEKIMTYNQAFGFKTWLTTIAKNLHIDQIRKKTSTAFTTEPESVVRGNPAGYSTDLDYCHRNDGCHHDQAQNISKRADTVA